MTLPRTSKGRESGGLPSQSCGEASAAPKYSIPNAEPSASVSCDLCGYGMPLPQHCIEQGAVLGLLVCSACIEDELHARTVQ